MNNQKGITLVELLATMVLLFIVSTLVLSIATQAIENYRQTETRSFAQQEANLLINQLTSTHRTSSSYEVRRDELFHYTITADNEKTSKINTAPFQLDLTLGAEGITVGESILVNVSEHSSIPLQVTVVSQPDQRFRTFEIDTNLYRIKQSVSSTNEE